MAEIAARMKRYEEASTLRRANGEAPLVVRLDGRAFHTFTRKLPRPFDSRLSQLMCSTMKHLVEEFRPAFGYTQSDEISLVWAPSKELPFSGRFQKFESLLAASASVWFNSELVTAIPEKSHALPIFDARAFEVPSLEEALACIMWRQHDATKNAVSMAAHAVIGHKQVFKKSRREMLEMLLEKGIDFDRDYPAHFRRGTFAHRVTKTRQMTEEDYQKIPEKYWPADRQITRSEVVEFDCDLFKHEAPLQVLFGPDLC